MNILFLTMNVFTDIEMHNIYSDLMKEFVRHGHRPYIVTPREKKSGEKTELIGYRDYSLLKVQIGNTSNVSLIEKGISTITLSSQFYNAVKRALGSIEFGLILYSTPPITLATPIARLKRLYKCKTYLMLKDIFPQNAVDLRMFSDRGLIYRYFRQKEKKLYHVSDRIGCMSPANIEYVLKHNPGIPKEKVGLCPNAVIPNTVPDRAGIKLLLREKYNIPVDATVYLYGGNLGKPQGIPFLIRCLQKMKDRDDCYFIICGSGSEYGIIQDFVQQDKPNNVSLIKFLPKQEYDELVMGCDVGMVFLDYQFTIPNFPSRVLSYMEYGIPVLVCADNATDLGKIAEGNGFGMFCPSNDVAKFESQVTAMNSSDLDEMGVRARDYLEENYSVQIPYQEIMEK